MRISVKNCSKWYSFKKKFFSSKLARSLPQPSDVSEEVMSDNGTQFSSDEFAQFCARHGIRHIRSTLGIYNRMARQKDMLTQSKTPWRKVLRMEEKYPTLFANFFYVIPIHSSFRNKCHTGWTVFEKTQLRTMLDLLRPTAADASSKNR